MESKRPYICLVDDELEEVSPLRALVEETGTVTCTAVEPGDVTKSLLEEADLLVVDFRLGRWDARDAQSQIGLQPPNGIALINVLREQVRTEQDRPPTAFSLITGDDNTFTDLLGARRPHVIARLSNLEWFYKKGERTNARQIVSLASAAASLPQYVKTELRPVGKLVEYLGVAPDDRLFERITDSVSRARPPIHQLTDWKHGLLILRWLLHRVLPHTVFLLDELALAARLRVQPTWLAEALQAGQPLQTEFAGFAYTGPLHDFDGPRWWRDAVEQWLWDETEGRSAENEAILELLEKVARQPPQPLGVRWPVVAFDEMLRPLPSPVDFDEVHEIPLDDWPNYAEPPYFLRHTVEQTPELMMYHNQSASSPEIRSPMSDI